MKICTCGHENEDGAQFCESCQEYLGWDKGRQVAGGEQQAVATAAPPETETAALPAPPVETGTATETETAAETEQDAASEVTLPQPLPATAAIQPAKEYQPPERRIPEPPKEPEPGELVCDQCGSGNRAIANFCRRCGASLANAQVAKRPSWWRRLLSWRRRRYAAGERRHRQTWAPKTAAERVRRGLFQASRLLGLLAVLGLVSFGAWRGDVVDRTKDAAHRLRVWALPHYEPVVPTAFRSTSHVKGHPAKRAFDQIDTTFWAEGAPNDGSGQKLVARFGREAHVARVGILAGDQAKPQDFVNQPVPRQIRIRFFNRNGRLIAGKRFRLVDKPKFQRFSIDAKHATRAVLTILSVYRSQKGHAASLTEVEYFEKT
jgi:hypothetical protein